MSKLKKLVAILASILVFSILGSSNALADEVLVTGSTSWLENGWIGAGAVQSSRNFNVVGSSMQVDVTDYQYYGDAFTIYSNGQLVGSTNVVTAAVAAVATAADGWADPNMSHGSFYVGPGLLTFFVTTNPWNGGSFGVRFAKINQGNALRVDMLGVTTEKNNVVSCTPGKYTFLNGGATPETAKIQSYVYTLLINGKAVSTLSSDNFKSVASHMFPAIAGNMAGTATLEGATWDLKGMSNYSAQCQVYATQSGGNIQSVTTGTYDSVALAAQAEEAAKVQRAKDLIDNWNASNEALIKKYRDQRLAGKP